MATTTTLLNSFLCVFTIFMFLASILRQATGENLVEKRHKIKHTLKICRLQFYWHDIVSGPNATAIPITKPLTPRSPTGFGTIIMIDDPLTLGPEITSKPVGRAQGFYGGASQEKLSLLMVMNFVFTDVKYNGSTISILGSNTVFNKVREMPVIGGSGFFRFARGYAQARTHSFNKTGDAIVKYDVYVMF